MSLDQTKMPKLGEEVKSRKRSGPASKLLDPELSEKFEQIMRRKEEMIRELREGKQTKREPKEELKFDNMTKTKEWQSFFGELKREDDAIYHTGVKFLKTKRWLINYFKKLPSLDRKILINDDELLNRLTNNGRNSVA